jgi:hypothetical protein
VGKIVGDCDMEAERNIESFPQENRIKMARHKLNIGLEILPPCQKCSVCKCFENLNDVKFDEVCRRKYQHLEYQINIIGFIMMYIFIVTFSRCR